MTFVSLCPVGDGKASSRPPLSALDVARVTHAKQRVTHWNHVGQSREHQSPTAKSLSAKHRPKLASTLFGPKYIEPQTRPLQRLLNLQTLMCFCFVSAAHGWPAFGHKSVTSLFSTLLLNDGLCYAASAPATEDESKQDFIFLCASRCDIVTFMNQEHCICL
eukprot:4330615-Amphidinium_carterae.1